VTNLTIYGNMTSYMIHNRNFELNAMVTVTCDKSNYIWKYCQIYIQNNLPIQEELVPAMRKQWPTPTMFLKSGRAGGAHRTHLRALGAVGVHGGVIVDISNTRNIVT